MLKPADKDAGHSCYACGGMVDEDGNAFSGEVPDMDEGMDDMPEPDDEDTNRAKFVSAIMKKGK